MTITWILGSGGLLGTALWNVLMPTEAILFAPPERLRWDNEYEFDNQLEKAVKSFVDFVGNDNCWQIYWAAGVGTMSSSESELAFETRTLSKLLGLIKAQPKLADSDGCFAFASSAGAIYAGSADDVITENTPASPTTAYAHEKLKQECLLAEFAITNCRTAVLVARITTLYGPGQAMGKRQGLFSEIARRILRNQCIQIYVPFDTIRDYITANDAAIKIITAGQAITGKSGVVVKIIASEQTTTIAEIISTFKKVTRRSPRIVTSANKLTDIYARRIQFRSTVILGNESVPRTSLLVGIAQVLAAERLAFVRSQQ